MKATTETMNNHEHDTPKRVVEGVMLTRSQIGWQTERLPIHGMRIVDNTGRLIATDIYDEEIAEQIVTEHNQHSALVAQRDRLLQIARDALQDRIEMNGSCCHDEYMVKLCSQCEIRELIATIEQEGRS